MMTKKIMIGGFLGAAVLFSTMSFANYGPRGWQGHSPMQQNYHQHPDAMAGRYYPPGPGQRVIVINRGHYNPYYGRFRHRPFFEFHFGR